jgi:predicted acyl esterase
LTLTLKGLPTGLAAEPRVHYYTMNESAGGSWHSAATWPVPGERAERWFVSGNQHLQRQPASRNADSTFTVSTDVDCPEGGVGPFMQPCLHPGQGLSLTSPPLDHDRIVTGNPVISLRVRVDRQDANVFAYLTDVGPDGHATVITEGASEGIPAR